MPNTTQFSQRILDWFDQHGRKNLPWQQDRNAYRVWISETMLQQTQVKTVIPYFNRFIQYFPHIDALANAKQDDVLTLWSGLGYYARARNLHKAAKIIQQHFDSELPLDLSLLQTLPGIGRSTAGAIVAIAGKQRAAILDGNVKRVLARFHGIDTWTGETKTIKKLWEIAESYTPLSRVDEYTQAIMDLGATVCNKTPACLLCPLNATCVAYQTNTVSCYPVKKPKKIVPQRKTILFILQAGDRVLLEKRPAVGIWGGLWSFPEYSLPMTVNLSVINDNPKAILKKTTWSDLALGQEVTLLPIFQHTFSHFQLSILPWWIKVKSESGLIMEGDRYLWYDLNEAEPAIAAPIKKILASLRRQGELLP